MATANKAQQVHPRSLVCSVPGCQRLFKNKQHMLQHQADSHTVTQRKQNAVPVPKQIMSPPPAPVPGSKKVLACGECGRKFEEQRALHQHQEASPWHERVSRLHKSTHCACHKCDATFRQPEHLDQHFLAEHSASSLRADDPKRAELARYFYYKWHHPGQKGTIVDILRVYNPGQRVKRFEDYRNKLKVAAKNRDPRIMLNGNEVKRFHGTTVRCELGVSGQSKLCSHSLCNLCNIVRLGFKKKKAQLDKFLRFGPGIYVTATSSKANDYVNMWAGAATRRAMLVSRVLAGKVFKVTRNVKGFVEPPEGYNAVCGEPGKDLNYDELVVYDDTAILPEFIIVYNWTSRTMSRQQQQCK